MERLIEYLTTGRTVAFVGAGASREVGIPGWRELLAGLLAELPVPADARRAEAVRLLDERKYPAVAEWIGEQAGDDYLFGRSALALADTGRNGVVAGFVARFAFAGIFTTNFDRVLERHLKKAGREDCAIHGNSEAELRLVELDVQPCLVHVHGRLTEPDTAIYKESQYAAARSAPKFEYLRAFLTAHLQTKRFLVIGYSFSDPDIETILERVAHCLRRETPIFAILADAPSDEVARLKKLYNVEVVTYGNASGTHRELASMIESLSPFVQNAKPRELTLDADLHRAQLLYLWNRFQLAPDIDGARVDALKSIAMSSLSSGSQHRGEVRARISKIVGLPLSAVVSAVDAAIDELGSGGMVEISGDVVRLTAEAEKWVSAATGQEQRLRMAFEGQVRRDLTETWGDARPDEVETAVTAALSALVAVFDERGVELANATFGGRTVNTKGAARLFATLSASARGLREDLRYRFVRYMSGLLTQPGESQRAYIEHLALAFFSLNALAMDPEGHRFKKEFLSSRALLVDSNVLIPLLPLEGTFRNDMHAVTQQARAAGIPLFTTQGFIDEVYAHGDWARHHVLRFGEQSAEVLQAARGEGYRRNAFLDGFVLHSVARRRLRFEDYLAQSVGGHQFTPEGIAAHLQNAEGIDLFDFSRVTSAQLEAFTDRELVEQYIEDRARQQEMDKGLSRIRAEAEAFTILRHWDLVATMVPTMEFGQRQASVLSQGTFFNELSMRGPQPMGRRVVVPPDALYGFLLKSGSTPIKAFSFRELMVSPFFDSSAHFLDKAKYRAFFAHLINEAERIYRENFDDFQSRLAERLSPELQDSVPEPLDRPLFLENLQNRVRLEAHASEQRAEVARQDVAHREAALTEQRRKLEADAAADLRRIEIERAALKRQQEEVAQDAAARERRRRRRAQLAAKRAANRGRKRH